MKFSKQWLIDTAERVAGTFVAAFLGAITIGTGSLNMAALQAAALAGVASAVTVIKSIIATNIGDPNSASMAPSVTPKGGGWNAPLTGPVPAEPPVPAGPSADVAAASPDAPGL